MRSELWLIFLTPYKILIRKTLSSFYDLFNFHRVIELDYQTATLDLQHLPSHRGSATAVDHHSLYIRNAKFFIMLDPVTYIVILIVFGILAFTTIIPIIGLFYPIGVVLLGLIFGWDASLIMILMIIVVVVNIINTGVALISAVPTGGISLILLLQYGAVILLAGALAAIYFILMIFEILGGILALELSIGVGIIGSLAVVGIGVATKKAKNSPRTCFIINDKPICYGKF